LAGHQEGYQSLSVLMAIFPDEPGLAGFIEAMDDRSVGDSCSYKTCNAPVTVSPPTNQHPMFNMPDALPVTQPAVSEHRRKKEGYQSYTKSLQQFTTVFLLRFLGSRWTCKKWP